MERNLCGGPPGSGVLDRLDSRATVGKAIRRRIVLQLLFLPVQIGLRMERSKCTFVSSISVRRLCRA